jgi:ubiquitin-activating enzyme E1
LHTFPRDAKTKEGNPFWSGPKRAPTQQPFDHLNPHHINFVVPMANLIAENLGIPQNRNINEITDMAAAVEVAGYKQSKVVVKLEGEEEKKEEP